jgi:DeoR family transcriptional regulator, suf operon transcriptional repressor
MSGPATHTQVNLPLPLGYRGVRASVLVELKKAQPLTTRELASRLGTSLNAVRHHLKELEEQALVSYERQHRGVGAPTFAYRLTPAGEGLFPRRYDATLTSLLDDLVDLQGRAAAVALLEARYSAVTQRLQHELEGRSSAERLQAVTRMLSEDGYMAEVSVTSGNTSLTEHNCAIQAVAERFPEICAAEARLISEVLRAEVHREKHILKGCSACEYRLQFESPDPSAGQPPDFATKPEPVAPPLQESS